MDMTTTAWRVETRTRASTIFAIVAAIAILFALAAPLYVSRGALRDLFFILTMLVLAQSWNLLAGYAGLVSIGQQAFVGFGGYAVFACIALLHLDPIPAIVVSGVAAALLAIPTGYFVFRLQGPYFGIGTWVVAEIVRLALAQWKTLGGGTGTSLPARATHEMWGVAAVGDLFGMRAAQATDAACYWLALALAAGTIGFIYWLLRSRQGLALAAMRDNQEAARSVGVDARRLKGLIYLAAAFITGLAGALIYVQKARISPDAAFSVDRLDGLSSSSSSSSAASARSKGRLSASSSSSCCRTLLADYGSWYLLILGLIGIVVMLFAPRGLWGLFADRFGVQFFPIRRTPPGRTNSSQDQGNAPWLTSTPTSSSSAPGPRARRRRRCSRPMASRPWSINRYRWLANTPRAHITNQRTMEVLRDLGRESRTRSICSPPGRT